MGKCLIDLSVTTENDEVIDETGETNAGIYLKTRLTLFPYMTNQQCCKKKETRVLPNIFIVILRKRFSSLDAYIFSREASLSLK